MGEARRRMELGMGPKHVNVDVNTLKDRVCEKCGGMFFANALRLKEVPAVYSGSGKPETLMINSGFVCVACGTGKSLIPEEAQKEKPAEEPKLVVVQ